MPHGLVHDSEEKLRAHFLHTGTPSATGLHARRQGPARAIGLTRANQHQCRTQSRVLLVTVVWTEPCTHSGTAPRQHHSSTLQQSYTRGKGKCQSDAVSTPLPAREDRPIPAGPGTRPRRCSGLLTLGLECQRVGVNRPPVSPCHCTGSVSA